MVFGDETIKVFLNAQGAADDIPEELAEFLKYLRTGNPGNAFTARIEEGREEGQALALLRAIEDVASNLKGDLEKACEMLNTSFDVYLELKRKMVV